MAKRSKQGNKSNARNKFNQSQHHRYSKDHPNTINSTSNASTKPNRTIKQGSEGFYRDRATINRLNMYRSKPDMFFFKTERK